jgi:HTH-type transcriptional regulator/antitoxin HigA
MKTRESRSTIATPPGATIKEQLDDRGMCQKEFALRMDISEKHISRLINGEVKLTPDVALRLESVLGVPADFWNNLEAIYADKLARVKVENEMDADIEVTKLLPYKQMVEFGWVMSARSAQERVVLLRRFFEVARLGLIDDLVIPGIAYRRVAIKGKSDYAISVWAQKAKLEARKIDTTPINLDRLQALLPAIRKMTTMDPNIACPQLVRDFAGCGVAVVFLPHIAGSFLHGASFYDGRRIVMGLTVRGKDADKFWFSFLHEMAHILLGHIGRTEMCSKEDEAAANMLARDALITPSMYQAFVAAGRFDRNAIIEFARKETVDAGIVVGRLQNDQHVPYGWFDDLKTKYVLLPEA